MNWKDVYIVEFLGVVVLYLSPLLSGVHKNKVKNQKVVDGDDAGSGGLREMGSENGPADCPHSLLEPVLGVEGDEVLEAKDTPGAASILNVDEEEIIFPLNNCRINEINAGQLLVIIFDVVKELKSSLCEFSETTEWELLAGLQMTLKKHPKIKRKNFNAGIKKLLLKEIDSPAQPDACDCEMDLWGCHQVKGWQGYQ